MVKAKEIYNISPGKFHNFFTSPHFWVLAVMYIFLAGIYTWDIVFYNQRWDWLYTLTIFEFRYSFHGSLFCIPIIYAAYIFWWKGALIAWLLSIAVVIPRIFTYKHDALTIFENVFYLLIPLLVVIYFSVERSWRQKERKALAEREAERKSYTLQCRGRTSTYSQKPHDDPTKLAGDSNRAQALVWMNQNEQLKGNKSWNGFEIQQCQFPKT
jgi:hypothetical protein